MTGSKSFTWDELLSFSCISADTENKNTSASQEPIGKGAGKRFAPYSSGDHRVARAGGDPGRSPAPSGSVRGFLQPGLVNLPERPETAQPPEEPQLLRPHLGPATPSPGSAPAAGHRERWGPGGGGRSPSPKELTGLSASSRPRLLHPPHYLHFITAGAAARGGGR